MSAWRDSFNKKMVQKAIDCVLQGQFNRQIKILKCWCYKTGHWNPAPNFGESTKPTFIKSERSFSVRDSFAAKIQSQISDNALSSLVLSKLIKKQKMKKMEKVSSVTNAGTRLCVSIILVHPVCMCECYLLK